jgi:hypothetical protein
MSSTLCVHNSKYSAKLTPYADLARLPVPAPLGPHHKPVPHVRLIDTLHMEIAHRGYSIAREQFALGADGHALFGVIDLESHDESGLTAKGRCLSFGFRNSTDMSMGIRGVAGQTVFVCDNMAMNGSTFAIQRKNTTGLDLGLAIGTGFDRFIKDARTLTLEIDRMAALPLADTDAKTLVYDALRQNVIPSRLFDDVDAFYFEPVKSHAPECEPRTVWGLHNAFTRAMRDLTPTRRFAATVDLGRLFGMGTPQPAQLGALPVGQA